MERFCCSSSSRCCCNRWPARSNSIFTINGERADEQIELVVDSFSQGSISRPLANKILWSHASRTSAGMSSREWCSSYLPPVM